ncbi:MAG: MFS transporter [Candidatus Glassbacteria bacterium]|nr:MFS transporter [Candidatus Glassbacteria bacterium]
MDTALDSNKRKSLLTGPFLRILMIHLAAMGSFGIYYFLPRFIRLTGGEEFLIGLVMGAPAAAALVIRLPTGRWVDRLGRRKMVITGLALFTAANFLPVFASGAGVYLILARAAAGASMVIYFTAIVTYVAEKAPAGRRAEAIALYGAAGFIAQAVSPWMCEQLLEILPYGALARFHVVFALAGVFTLVALGFSFLMEHDDDHEEMHLAPDPWHTVLRSPTLIYVIIPSVVFGIGYTSIFNFITDFTELNSLGPTSYFFISYSVTVIVLRLTTGKMLDWLDRRMVTAVSLTVIVAGLFLASVTGGAAGLVLVGILTGTGHGYIFPALSTLTFDSSPARNRGMSMALYMLGFDLSTMAMSPLLGKVAEHWDYFAMFRVAGVILLAGTAVYLTGWRYHSPESIRRSAAGRPAGGEPVDSTGAPR